MNRPNRTVGVIVLTAGMIAGQAVIAVEAHAATTTTRYVSPGGTGSTCSQSAPCLLFPAVAGSVAGDVVVLEPGTYPSVGHAYTTTLTDSGLGIAITGEAGHAMPVINSSASGRGIDSYGFGASVSNLQLNYTGNGAALDLDGANADHVAVFSSSASGDGACEVGGSGNPSVISDSVCVATGVDASAVSDAPNGGNFSAVVRNVTGIATGAGGVGLESDEIGDGTDGFAATNSIFKGTADDVVALGPSTGTAAISLSHCDYQTTMTSPMHATITPGAGNITTAPAFVDPTDANFREAAGSPTIDKGTATGIPAGDTDLAGAPRTIGTAPDMGAYEHAAEPTISGLHISHVKKHSMLVTVSVDPGGATTTVKVAVKHAHHTKKITTSAGSGATVKKVHVHLKGLTAKTKYKIGASAKNSLGSEHAPKVSKTTK